MSDARVVIGRIDEEIMPGLIKDFDGSELQVPVENRDYILQCFVSLDEVVTNPNSGKIKYKMKKSGEMTLHLVPYQNEEEHRLLPD